MNIHFELVNTNPNNTITGIENKKIRHHTVFMKKEPA